MPSQNTQGTQRGTAAEEAPAQRRPLRRPPARVNRQPTRAERMEDTVNAMAENMARLAERLGAIAPENAPPPQPVPVAEGGSPERFVRRGRPVEYQQNPSGANAGVPAGSRRTNGSVFNRLGGEAEEVVESSWAPSGSRTHGTTDLRDQVNQQRGGVHARLGPIGARNHRNMPEVRPHNEPTRSRGSNQIGSVMPDDPNHQLLQRIEKLERERNRSGDIQDMMQDAEPPFST